MKRYIIFFAIGSSILLLFYTGFKLFDNGSFKFALLSYGLFLFIFLYSIIYLFQNKWVPITIQLITLLIVFILPPLIRTEVNFYHYKEDREEIIRMLVEGKLKKKQAPIKGFPFTTHLHNI